MHDQPSTLELVQAVRGFLTDVAMKELTGHSGFHARVAANALAIVERELSLRPQAETEEIGRLQALLGVQAADADALNRVLCERIQQGALTETDRALLSHLKLTALDQTAIDQPTYSGRRPHQEQA